jgi:hypothetical protein
MAKQSEHIYDELKVVEFNGHPILEIPLGDGRGISFGLKKAEAILENIEAVKKFVESKGKEC